MNDSVVVRRLKLTIRKLQAENKLLKRQLTPICKIDFQWKSSKGGKS